MSHWLRVSLRVALAALGCLVIVAAASPIDDLQALDQVVLMAADDGSNVSLAEDQTLVIALMANPSTGFLWEPLKFDPTILVLIDQDELTYAEPSASGAAAQQVLRFRAIAAGSTHLQLAYRRPWQADVAPAATFKVTVTGVGPFTGAYVVTPSPAPAPAPRVAIEPAYSMNGQALPASFNWCDQGGCTPVKDQGGCGSCWAFATAGVFELGIKIKDGVTRDLSEQYLVSCNTEGYGCNGGLWVHDYHQDYAPPGEPAAGAVYEGDFPYVAADVACNSPHTHRERISAWANVPGGSYGQVPDVADMKQALHDHGPLAVGVCVGSQFDYYSGGVFRTNESSSCPNGTNHGVVLVGWDDGDGAWYLRNSWGTGWGEAGGVDSGGYMRIAYGVSMVGEDATYVVYGGDPPVNPTPTPRPGSIRKLYLPVIARQNSVAPVTSDVLNPGFELGAQYWTEYSWQGWNLILRASDLNVPPHGGSWAVWLGGDHDEVAYVEQRLTVPPGRPYLTYWHWIGSEDTCGYDFGGVIVNRTKVVNQYNLCASEATGGWIRHSVNLSAYKGQTIYVQIRAETDSSYNSNLFVDDVSFQASAAAAGGGAPGGGMPPDMTASSARSSSRGEPAATEEPRLLGR